MSKTGTVTELSTAQSQEELQRKVEKEILGGDSYSTEGLIYRMQRSLANMLNDKIDLGRCALAIQEMVGQGNFQKLMKENLVSSGMISLRSIYNSMGLARFVLAHGGGKIDYIRELPRMKQLMLAGAPDDQVDEEAGTIFGMSEMDIKGAKIADLKAIIEKLNDKVEKQKTDLARGKEQLTEAREKIDRVENAHRFVQGEDEKIFNAKLGKYKTSIQAILLWMSEWDPAKGSPSENAAWLAAWFEISTMIDTEHAEALRRARQNGAPV